MKLNIRITDENGNTGQADITLTPPDNQPLGPQSPTGSWALIMEDDFNTLDPAKWVIQDGREMNGVRSKSGNCSVENSVLKLKLSEEDGTIYGAVISTNADWNPDNQHYMMARGEAIEALIMVSANPNTGELRNWGGFWTSGPDWPASGENDLFEYGPDASINYHGVQDINTNDNPYTDNGGGIPGYYNQWVRVALHRTPEGLSKVYWNGTLMRTINTNGHEYVGATQAAIFSLGHNGTPILGDAGALRVDWFRAYRPA